jgi:hypothetical protein
MPLVDDDQDNNCSNCGCHLDDCQCCSACGSSDCDWCGDCDSEGCQCSCEDDDYESDDWDGGGGSTNRYSYDPIHGLSWSAFQPNHGERNAPRYGLEIELSGYDEQELRSFNRAFFAVRVQNQQLFTESQGYCTPCSDGSITGNNPAELKTPPLTKWEHYAAHLASMMDSVERDRFDWAALYRQPWRYKAKLMQSLVDVRHQPAFMPSAKAWSNGSCGLHVNCDISMASLLTWAKMLWFVHHLHPDHLCDFSGRRHSSSYAQQVHYRRFGYIRSGLMRLQYHDSRPGFQKYEVINISKPNLFEVRLFQSTVNPLRLLANMELLEALRDFMSQLSVTQAMRAHTEHLGHYLFLNRWQYPFAYRWLTRSKSANSLRRGAFVSRPIPALSIA